jgi:hypothetical protein
MTIPEERTRAVIQTRAFLRALRDDSKLRSAIREEARRLLRHYPSAMDMQYAARNERAPDTAVVIPMFSPDIGLSWAGGYPSAI